jgi:geranylgeranyl transferase type-2 subunit beta
MAVQQANVCYSWWILSALSIIGRVGWIDTSRLELFILNFQDNKDDGIANRPRDMPDVYHMFFGLCGLSLIGHMEKIGSRGGAQYLHCRWALFGSRACVRR